MTTEHVNLADDLLTFAQFAPKAHSELELLDALMKRVEAYGVTHVAAARTTDINRKFSYGPAFGKVNMAWGRTYLMERLFLDDPIMAHSLTAQEADYWDNLMVEKELTKANRRVMSMAASVGVKDGYLCPIPTLNGVVVVSFQGERLDRDPRVSAFLRAMAIYYGTAGQRIVERVQSTSAANGGLTHRQMRIVHLSAQGMSARTIGEELGISSRTVEFHRNNARAKLGARNITEAVALVSCTAHNLFTPS